MKYKISIIFGYIDLSKILFFIVTGYSVWKRFQASTINIVLSAKLSL